MPGFTHGFHEGSRSEYLAAYVFSAFGTASAIPHQEDHGFDLYCTLAQGQGRTRFAAKPYTVQVKSTRDPWVFDSPESVGWLIEHPLPMFLCVVSKREMRLTMFQTTPKYYYWAFGGALPKRLELRPDFEAVQGQCKYWQDPGRAELSAPILDFTVGELADKSFFERIRDALDSWVELEYQNLFQITTRTRQWLGPYEYRPNEPTGQSIPEYVHQSGPAATPDEPREAMKRLRYSIGWVMEQSTKFGDWQGAARCALLLRHFCRDDSPNYAGDFCLQLNRAMGVNQASGGTNPPYLFVVLDRLASQMDAELAGVAQGS